MKSPHLDTLTGASSNVILVTAEVRTRHLASCRHTRRPTVSPRSQNSWGRGGEGRGGEGRGGEGRERKTESMKRVVHVATKQQMIVSDKAYY